MSSAPRVVFQDGRYNGRTLEQWLPDVVATVVERFDPLKIIVFGSLARGEPAKDIDLLVVLPAPADKRRAAVAVRAAIRAPVPVDVIVTDPVEIEERGGLVGTVLEPALREGRVVHERA